MRLRLSYANVVSSLALMVALGGSATAAAPLIGGEAIKNESVTGKDVRNRSLGTADVKDGSLLRRDFKPGQLPAGVRGAAGPQGQAGPPGRAGTNGATGSRGPSDAYQADDASFVYGAKTVSVELPAGSYSVIARTSISNGTGSPVYAYCQIYSGFGVPGHDSGFISAPATAESPITLFDVFELPTAQSVYFACDDRGPSVGFGRTHIIATAVANTH